MIILFLVCFGLVMVYSTSYYSGMRMKNPDPAFYLKKQVISTIIGSVVFVFCIFFDYRFYYKLAPFIYLGALLSVLLILTPLGVEINHARRWINVGFGTIQPAEICKLAVIITVSSFAVYAGKGIDKWRNLFVVGAGNFPHNGGCNPTGTVGALGYRCAEGILKYSKKGGSLV